MSFLSYLSHPALVAASIGGVSIGVALLLLPWKSMKLVSSPSSSSLAAQSEGNCAVIDNLGVTLSEISGQTTSDYYFLSCQAIKAKWSESLIPNKFLGAFPKKIFLKNNWHFNNKIELYTGSVDLGNKIQDEEYPFRIKFLVIQFMKPDYQLSGNWKYESFEGVGDESSKSGAIIQLDNSQEKIYIIPEEWNNN